jgi:predicted nucleotidyltransferase
MDRKQLEEIAEAIIKNFEPKRIILFGSDVDLCVEMESERQPPERAVEVSSIFGLRKWPLDVVVYTPSEVERLKKVRGTLLSIIEAEGEVLYERP